MVIGIFEVKEKSFLKNLTNLTILKFTKLCGCSSGVEHNLAKVRVVGSNPIVRSKISLPNHPCYIISVLVFLHFFVDLAIDTF